MRATTSTSARWPNCRKERAKVAGVTFFAPKISRPSSMTIASVSSKSLVSLRCLMISMISREIPSPILRLVSRPLKLAVELPGSGEDGQFANSPAQSRLVSQIAVERPGMSREFGTVQQDTARPPQTPDRPALGVGETVINPLPCTIQLLAPQQRQPATGHWVDILRIHSFPSI